MSPKKVVFVGVNTPNPEQETGLYSLFLDEDSGKLEVAQKFDAPKNIGFFHLDEPNFLYALSGGGINKTESPNDLWRFKLDRSNPQNLLEPYHIQLDDGSGQHDGACYITVSKEDPKRLVIAYYFTGNTDVYKEVDNKLVRESTIQFKDFSNVDKERQEKSHPHCVIPVEENNIQDYFVVDLGADRVYLIHVNDDHKVSISDSIQVPAGAGPRHVVKHPSSPLLFVLNELDNTLLVYKVNSNRTFTLTDKHTTLVRSETDVVVESDKIQNAAHLAVSNDGQYVLCSNRGTLNNIVSFKIVDLEHGKVKVQSVAGPGGHFPRYFALHGKFLLVANQKSKNVVVFRFENGQIKEKVSEVNVNGNPIALSIH
uniref:6-phosphogluconolactonase n=1 Tax=Acrobeloides nanus TaxID=290746 RepID=A0A914E8G0_9BILA